MVVRDRFWAWGHCPGAHNVGFNLPASTIAPAAGAQSLGLRNLFMVRFGDEPRPPFGDLAGQLGGMRKVVWSMVGAGGRTSPEERALVLDLCRDRRNITGIVFDDFWGSGQPVLPLAELRRIRERATRLDLDLWSVLYVRELFAPEVRPYLPFFDRHTLWTWDPRHLNRIEDKLDRFQDLVPGGRHMGVYLWDYGRRRPMPMALLVAQCQEGLRRIEAGTLEGMVFLATCICDLDIEAVRWARSWIAEVGDRRI